ncbi:phosphoprotein phosphatase [Schizosaccharomyces japonicus yFS275]|uniref:Phosphoprotein phosphatase n=1 Tax=Schizosaccharomyces japonicus (strain yFS275 / FY16936) TaxID=402676 RepID=B6JZW5_SCHJY|nr:phosphoprotein phosphatase [Schizosaccharomyces japonicus yFS275]EEB06115.1 phosphoprotein phosphatase [Schizosaccharomyces japonicus yFS275]
MVASKAMLEKNTNICDRIEGRCCSEDPADVKSAMITAALLGKKSSTTSMMATSAEAAATISDPPNFGVVCPGLVYRSGCPSLQAFPFLHQLHIRSILSLRQEEYTDEELAYMRQNNIQYFHIAMPGSKLRKNGSSTSSSSATSTSNSTEVAGEFNDIDIDALVHKALSVLLDSKNLPILVHCSGGKHRTGIVIGCFRALLGWQPEKRLEEYSRYSHPKERDIDEEYIRNFTPDWSKHGYRRAPL